jgi:4-hydroxy-3-polyprenylbenzoate decarboxylase
MALLDTTEQQSIHYRGLRDWLDKVQGMGELLCVNGADWDAEMGSITQMLTEKSNNTAPAILFDEIPGYPKGFRTLYGHFSTIKRVALTLGLPLQHDRRVDIVQRYHQRMQNLKTIPPRFVKDGPVLQNVLEGDAIDVLKFPVPRHHEKDTSRYIGTACCVMTQDPDDGWYNLGAYPRRSMIVTRSAARLPKASTAGFIATRISNAVSR